MDDFFQYINFPVSSSSFGDFCMSLWHYGSPQSGTMDTLGLRFFKFMLCTLEAFLLGNMTSNGRWLNILRFTDWLPCFGSFPVSDKCFLHFANKLVLSPCLKVYVCQNLLQEIYYEYKVSNVFNSESVSWFYL